MSVNVRKSRNSSSHGTASRQLSNKSDVHINLIQRTSLHMPPDERPYQGLQQVKISVLGAQGVGKTSIVQQFVSHDFHEAYSPTRQRTCYYPSIIVNNHLYEVKIIDCPPISYFPMSSLAEWTEFRGYGLRSATAYVLVFDVTNEESLQYVRTLRDQILECRSDCMLEVPVIIVGNKYDLPESSHIGKREIANIIKKQWKCAYVECSAKCNWHIISLFKEVMKAVDLIDYTQHRITAERNRQNAQRGCVIL